MSTLNSVRLCPEAARRAQNRRRQLADEVPGVQIPLSSAVNNMILAPEPLIEAVAEFLEAWEDDGNNVLDKMVWTGREEIVKANAPGHAHKFPGVWDSDNGPRASRPCRLCHALARVRRLL